MNDSPRRDDDVNDQVNNPEDARPLADWIEGIGDENEDPETILDNLEEFGYDTMDEGFFDYNGRMPSDMPGWNETFREPTEREQALVQHNVNTTNLREMEDAILDAVDAGRPADDGESIPDAVPTPRNDLLSVARDAPENDPGAYADEADERAAHEHQPSSDADAPPRVR